MNRTEMLLVILAEECAEVSKVASLARDFGLKTAAVESVDSEREDKRFPEEFRSRVSMEIEDLMSAAEMLQEDSAILDFSLKINPSRSTSSVIVVNTELGKLIRSCADLAQVCSKALRFGLINKEEPKAARGRRRHHNRDRIALELSDIIGIAEKLKKHNAIPKFKHWRDLRDQKKARVEILFSLSKLNGSLSEL